MTDWILYGANGYTGELIAREAVRRGLHPVMAGRNGQQISKLAGEIDCPARIFALSRVAEIVPHLAGARLLLNCAGPFSATAVPMMEACLAAGVHYLDITGEIEVIEAAAARSERAQRADIVLIPAVGFDVVPSDCLAALLAAELPSATHLQLAFQSIREPPAERGTVPFYPADSAKGDSPRQFSNVSPGTAKTLMESLPRGGRVRIDGRIARVPLAWKSREVPFAEGTKTVVTTPWGDVASAYYSTGIGNIEVYTPVSAGQLRSLRRWRWLLPLLRWGSLRRYAQRRVERTTRGPTAGDRAAGRASFWGRVEDDAGQSAQATLTTPSAYDLTVLTALASVEQVLAGNVPPGFHPPSRAFGREFILSIPGTALHQLLDQPRQRK